MSHESVLRGSNVSISQHSQLFPSFFLGGFECSTHFQNGAHLDLTAATYHDRFAKVDYARLRTVGMKACRDGVNWPLSEPRPKQFNFSRAISMMQAAKSTQIKVIWDLMHFGWPLGLDIFSPEFITRFSSYAREFIRILVLEGGAEEPPIISPINEISFLSWAGGERGLFNPFVRERAAELKFQLTRAAIEAMRSMKEECSKVLFLHCDPIMHIASRSDCMHEFEVAEDLRLLQYQSWDMISGRTWQNQLNGDKSLLNIIGVNYYRNNQRFVDGEFIDGTDRRYRPLSEMLVEVGKRYQTPMIISETGAESEDRPIWLRYVVGQALQAIKNGCPLEGLTWYPIVNHPGWTDDRHCENGLWDYASADGHRSIYQPLAEQFLSLNRDHFLARNASGKDECSAIREIDLSYNSSLLNRSPEQSRGLV